MLGREMREDVTQDIPVMIEQFYTPTPYSRFVNDGEVLIAGVGGLVVYGQLRLIQDVQNCPSYC